MKKLTLKGLLVGVMLGITSMLTGCIFDVSDSDMLTKPRLPLELEEISQVLKEHFNEDIKLITPLDGENKKSVQFIDLDMDGEDEVVVLHSKETDQYAIKITVLSKKNDKWRINTDIQGIGYDVNKIAFPDLDGNGVKEIVVGWQSGAQLNKGLSVYMHSEKGYEEIFKDSYTEFVTGDINDNKQEELVVVKLSRSDSYAKTKVYTLTNGRLGLLAENHMDGFVNEYAGVQIGKINPYSTGIVIDAKVGARSGFTDVFVYQNNQLKNLFFDEKWKVTRKTYRQVDRQSTDVNRDGILEIPILAPGNKYERSSEYLNYITVWNQVNAQDGLESIMRSFDNKDDGYRLIFPASWSNQIGIVENSEGIFFDLYAEGFEKSMHLLEIKQIERKNWDLSKEEFTAKGYFELGKNLDKVYLGKTYYSPDEASHPYLITEEICRQLFVIL